MREAWDRFWFGEVDPRRLALLRIGWALVALWAYVPLLWEGWWLFSDEGLLPLETIPLDWISLLVNPLWQISSPGGVQAFIAATLGLLVLTALGLGTRVVQPLAWLMLLSLVNRNGAWTSGADSVLRVFGFYLMFLPTGRVWSLDARLFPQSTTAPTAWPLRLFQLQVCILYVKTGMVKAAEPIWQSGEAVFQAMSCGAYWRFRMEPLLSSRWFQGFCALADYATLVVEIGFPLVWIRRLRPFVLLAGLGLHVGISAFLDIGAFTFAMLWTYLAFVELPERR